MISLLVVFQVFRWYCESVTEVARSHSWLSLPWFAGRGDLVNPTKEFLRLFSISNMIYLLTIVLALQLSLLLMNLFLLLTDCYCSRLVSKQTHQLFRITKTCRVVVVVLYQCVPMCSSCLCISLNPLTLQLITQVGIHPCLG